MHAGSQAGSHRLWRYMHFNKVKVNGFHKFSSSEDWLRQNRAKRTGKKKEREGKIGLDLW